MESLLNFSQSLLFHAIGFLDTLPDSIRAILAALVLTTLLRFFEQRIPPHEIQYGQSFRKAALVAALLIPLMVWLFPASRMIVFVEELTPTSREGQWVWNIPLALWLLGIAVTLNSLTLAYRRARQEMARMPQVDDEKILSRLSHWQRRLGMSEDCGLVFVPGDRPRFLTSQTRIAIPRAVMHWPGTLQDILLITALSHLQRRHRRWHLFGQIMTCVYWPLPWIQSLHANLLGNFQQSADRLADSCYRDSIGYSRALRQLEARLAPAAGASSRNGTRNPVTSPGRLNQAFSSYLIRLRDLMTPALEPRWQLSDLVAIRSSELKQLWMDPYDKVVLFVGQAVFLAFLLTGTTLRERPPEIDYEYSMPFELFWKEHFHRSLELMEKTQPTGK